MTCYVFILLCVLSFEVSGVIVSDIAKHKVINSPLKLAWDVKKEDSVVELTIFDVDQQMVIGIYVKRRGDIEGTMFYKNRLTLKTVTALGKNRFILTILNPTNKDLLAEYTADFTFENGQETPDVKPINMDLIADDAEVKATLGQDIYLIWRYKSNEIPARIIFTRGKDSEPRRNLADWTQKSGLHPGVYLNGRLKFSQAMSHEGTEIIVKLKIMKSQLLDYDWNYFCQSFTGDNTRHESAIVLKLEKFLDTVDVETSPVEFDLIVVGIVCCIMILAICAVICIRKTKKRKQTQDPVVMEPLTPFSLGNDNS